MANTPKILKLANRSSNVATAPSTTATHHGYLVESTLDVAAHPDGITTSPLGATTNSGATSASSREIWESCDFTPWSSDKFWCHVSINNDKFWESHGFTPDAVTHHGFLAVSPLGQDWLHNSAPLFTPLKVQLLPKWAPAPLPRSDPPTWPEYN